MKQPDRIFEELRKKINNYKCHLKCWEIAGVITNQLAKEAKRKYFSDTVLLNSHKPRVWFKVTNSALNAPHTVGIEASLALCENVLHFFIDKVTSAICHLFHHLPLTFQCQSPARLFLTHLSLWPCPFGRILLVIRLRLSGCLLIFYILMKKRLKSWSLVALLCPPWLIWVL